MKLGLSSGGITNDYGYEKGFEYIKKCGFDAVDIAFGLFCKDKEKQIYMSEDEILTQMYDIKKLCENNELIISQTHGLLTTCVPEKEETDFLRWVAEMHIKASAQLEAPVCVFHSVKLRQWEFVNIEPEFLHSKNIEFFQDFLTPICKEHNVKFAIETHGRSLISTGSVIDFTGDSKTLKENYDRIKSDYKSICMDTGHTHEVVCFGGATVPEAIRLYGKAISTLHLHDNEGNYDSHLPPLVYGKDNINWEETFDALEEVGYDGVYNYELNLGRYGKYKKEAIEFLGKFLRDFTENKGRI